MAAGQDILSAVSDANAEPRQFDDGISGVLQRTADFVGGPRENDALDQLNAGSLQGQMKTEFAKDLRETPSGRYAGARSQRNYTSGDIVNLMKAYREFLDDDGIPMPGTEGPRRMIQDQLEKIYQEQGDSDLTDGGKNPELAALAEEMLPIFMPSDGGETDRTYNENANKDAEYTQEISKGTIDPESGITLGGAMSDHQKGIALRLQQGIEDQNKDHQNMTNQLMQGAKALESGAWGEGAQAADPLAGLTPTTGGGGSSINFETTGALKPKVVRSSKWKNDEVYGVQAYDNMLKAAIGQGKEKGIPAVQIQKELNSWWDEKYEAEKDQSYQKYVDRSTFMETGMDGLTAQAHQQYQPDQVAQQPQPQPQQQTASQDPALNEMYESQQYKGLSKEGQQELDDILNSGNKELIMAALQMLQKMKVDQDSKKPAIDAMLKEGR